LSSELRLNSLAFPTLSMPPGTMKHEKHSAPLVDPIAVVDAIDAILVLDAVRHFVGNQLTEVVGAAASDGRVGVRYACEVAVDRGGGELHCLKDNVNYRSGRGPLVSQWIEDAQCISSACRVRRLRLLDGVAVLAHVEGVIVAWFLRRREPRCRAVRQRGRRLLKSHQTMPRRTRRRRRDRCR
jgi:hypothetical protein